MEKLTLKVKDMSCEHCVKAITTAVNTLSGVFKVAIDLKTKTVTIEHDPMLVTSDTIRCKIEEQGYDITV